MVEASDELEIIFVLHLVFYCQCYRVLSIQFNSIVTINSNIKFYIVIRRILFNIICTIFIDNRYGKIRYARINININIFYNYFIFTIKWIEEIIIKLGTKRMYLEQFYYYLS